MVLILSTLVTLDSTPAVLAQGNSEPEGPQAVWDVSKQGSFVMASCRDEQGRLWFGTEDKGVWCYDPNVSTSQGWRQFTVKDGLGDNNGYALAVDGQGRVWVGHQNHGVSVFNGKQWRNYDVLEGPLGAHVFDIAVSPVDGDVWLATSRGLARYGVETGTWSYQGRWSGLPSDQIQCLAFAKDGTLFVGTQCDGLAVGSAREAKTKGDYYKWRTFTGPGWMPLYATGEGLPSDLINDILVAKDGTVYVATTYGLARSDDNGKSWLYLRGKDWKEKLKGLTFPPTIPPQPEIDVLREDYVTTIAEDADGLIWLGHPTKGVELRSQGGDFSGGGGVVEAVDEERERQRLEKAQKQLDALAAGEIEEETPEGNSTLKKILREAQNRSQSERTDYVNSILPIDGAPPLVCGAGSGVIQLGSALSASMPRRRKGRASNESSVGKIAALPLPATAPTLAELQEFQTSLANLKNPWGKYSAAYLSDDWKTQGDWIGRYGMRYALLCSMQSPLDHRVINDFSYHVEGRLGLHPYVKGETYENQGLRHWVHRERWDDPRVLWNPLIGYRRQADSDDNGEVYPMSYEGPDIWMGVRIPAGTHRVALYFFNKDGHDGNNRVRDYIVDVKRGNDDLLLAEDNPTLARARVRDFWGGVYKNFVLQGPGDYYFIIRKNNCFNTIVQSVMIDKLNGPPTDYEKSRDIWMGSQKYEPATIEEYNKLVKAAVDSIPITRSTERASLQAAITLWYALDTASSQRGWEQSELEGRILAYRAAKVALANSQTASNTNDAGSELLRCWRWKLPLWSQSDRQEFAAVTKRAWTSFVQDNPAFAKTKK